MLRPTMVAKVTRHTNMVVLRLTFPILKEQHEEQPNGLDSISKHIGVVVK